jgi:hypothetical protein
MGTNGSKGANASCSWDTLGMVVARRVEAANVSDRRVGARLLDGLQSGFPSIRMVMADAGYQSGKLALKARCWRLVMCSRPGVCTGTAPRADHLPGLVVHLRPPGRSAPLGRAALPPLTA